jgi:hypothetical protein
VLRCPWCFHTSATGSRYYTTTSWLNPLNIVTAARTRLHLLTSSNQPYIVQKATHDCLLRINSGSCTGHRQKATLFLSQLKTRPHPRHSTPFTSPAAGIFHLANPLPSSTKTPRTSRQRTYICSKALPHRNERSHWFRRN